MQAFNLPGLAVLRFFLSDLLAMRPLVIQTFDLRLANPVFKPKAVGETAYQCADFFSIEGLLNLLFFALEGLGAHLAMPSQEQGDDTIFDECVGHALNLL